MKKKVIVGGIVTVLLAGAGVVAALIHKQQSPFF